MRWSQAFIPTLRDDPADAEAVSHKLLVRAGFMRQLMSGSYSMLPLGKRVCRKIEGAVRQEMERMGAQEFELPTLHPGEVWQRSGRWEVMGSEMFRLQDRRGTDLCLGVTHEEIFTLLASEMRSYKSLPQLWFQVQSKFRDEPRPKSGLLRVREFVMKDSYSFDIDHDGLDRSFQLHFETYRKIFSRIGLETIAVEASSGAMGDGESVEFMVPSSAGEDVIVSCASCGYAANVEKATSRVAPLEDGPAAAEPEKFATPGVRTIEDLAAFDGGAPGERQIKTLVQIVDGEAVLVLLRGDHDLVEQKLLDGLKAYDCRAAGEEEVRAVLGASAGSLGAVGVRDPELRIVADEQLRGRTGMLTGANEDGFHLRGVDVGRDIEVTAWLDLREAKEGEPCPLCDAPLAAGKAIEVAHIFKLGTKYAESLGASVLDEDGKSHPVVMGSYGIGIGRAMAAVVEAHNDANGIVWPVSVAPFEVVVSVIKPKDVATSEASARIYEELIGAGIDVLLDDRDERPGVKFKDADLVGIPYRITVGPKGLADGTVDFQRRRDGESRTIDVNKAASWATETILEERR